MFLKKKTRSRILECDETIRSNDGYQSIICGVNTDCRLV
jgi:hypothetical protein